MDKKENVDASEKLKEAMIRLNDKLDNQLNGDVVNDTMVKHIKKCVEKVVENNDMLDDMVKAGVPEDASEWLLFLFAMMSAGPIPDEMKTEDLLELALLHWLMKQLDLIKSRKMLRINCKLS